MDLSFPGQRTATVTSCIPHNSLYMPGPCAGKSDTWIQIFQNDSKFVKQKSHWLHSSIKFANPGALIFNVCVNNQGFWQFRFHRVLFNPDSQNGFSVHHDSRTPEMVDHGITKISLSPLCKAVWGSCCSMLFTEQRIHVPAAKIVHKEDWLTPSAPIGIQELFQKYNCKYDLRKKKCFILPKRTSDFLIKPVSSTME